MILNLNMTFQGILIKNLFPKTHTLPR